MRADAETEALPAATASIRCARAAYAMKTLDLTEKRITLDELLKLAAVDSVRILTADGRAFVLEEAGDFEKEVELLGATTSLARRPHAFW